MSHCGLGGWIDQFKNCFARTEMQSDRNATEDPTKSCRVTKYRGLIKKVKRTWSCKRRAHMAFRDLFRPRE